MYNSIIAKIIGRIQETRDTFLYRVILDDVDKNYKGVFDYRPGQFAILSLDGVGECPISISSTPDVHEWLEFCIRAVGSVTGEICALGEGDRIGLRGPYGRFFPLDECTGKDLLFIAGGIGLAPLRSLINAVMARRDAFGNVQIVYGAKTPSEICFREELDEWRTKGSVYITVDRVSNEWNGHVGLVPDYVDELNLRKRGVMAFVCGPPVMIKVELERFASAGCDPSHVWTTLERKMRCGVGKCCRCAMGKYYVCTDGPVFSQAELLAMGQKL